ncbi:MAG: hypothetical protein E7464_05005 [Ruminococcaceae bacterium]|nr:hypothetical protein [Oscillospiraceae bacterium]
MTQLALQNEILSCLWSKDLKNHITKTAYTFSDTELLGIAYHFAPTYDVRLHLLQLLADHAPSVSAHAQRCIEWQKELLSSFRHIGENEVYELQIKESPEEIEERFLCASYETALTMIDGYYKEYDFTSETESARYTIVKRKVLQPNQVFCDDSLGVCILGAEKKLISVDGRPGETENGPCCHSCCECQNPCVQDIDVCFPSFVADRSPVRYRQKDGSLHYGVHLSCGGDEPSDVLYIVPLQRPNACGFDAKWADLWHEHISGPNVEIIPVSSLPEALQNSYHAFLDWLDTQESFY